VIGQRYEALISVLATAVVVGVIGAASNGIMAAPTTYDFTGAVVGNQALGTSHTYTATAAGGPDITAISGSYAQLGSGAPVTGDAFTPGGQLVGNNDGSDGMGVGICFRNGCNHGHIDDNPEIDASGREAVRLDITSLISGFNSFTVGADSGPRLHQSPTPERFVADSPLEGDGFELLVPRFDE